MNRYIDAGDTIRFSYYKCDGMSQHKFTVDKEWFNTHNTDSITAEELEELARADRENSKIEGCISWIGLG